MELEKQVQENIVVAVNDEDVDKASSTWSGFLYQGKVAIYTVLKYINRFYPNISEIIKYKLEIEYLEDFAILKDNVHISLHQVKAKPNTDTIGSYNEANLNLLGKLDKYKTVLEVSLHTAVNIKPYTRKNLFDNLSGFNVEGKKAQLKTYKDLVFKDDRFNELVEKLKISCSDGLVPIERAVELNKIKDLILSEIDTFYTNCGDKKLRDLYTSIQNKEHIYSNFINMLEDKVHKDHLKELKDEKIIISFEEFLEILDNESIFQLSNKTVSSLLLHLISEDFTQYCKYYEIADNDFDSLDIWEKHINLLKQFDPDEFLLLCRKLTPQLPIQNKSSIDIVEFRSLMQPDGVQDSFLHGLMQFKKIIEPPIDAHSSYVINKEYGTRYILTTINRNQSPSAHRILGEDILNNLSNDEDMFNMLFEVDGYINSRIDNEFSGNITMISSNIESNVIGEGNSEETITNQKIIRFVSIDRFK